MQVRPTPLLRFARGIQAFTVHSELILIRPDRADDASLIAHETKHCQQMRATGTWLWHWRYVTSRKFRLQQELEAYRVQLAMRPSALDGICNLLATRYWLGITPAEAKTLLLQPAK